MEAFSTSTWSDALDRLAIAGVMQGLAWRAGAARFGGRAVTIREETGALGSQPAAAFDVAAMLDAARPGDVLVIDVGGAAVSSFGGLAARAAAARGLAGALVDGGCRDVDEIRAAAFSVCSRHLAPTSGKQRIRIVAINVPIVCGGITVSPGDYVAADETGAIAVPAARFAEASALAAELDARDREFVRALDNGGAFREIAKKLGHV